MPTTGQNCAVILTNLRLKISLVSSMAGRGKQFLDDSRKWSIFDDDSDSRVPKGHVCYPIVACPEALRQ